MYPNATVIGTDLSPIQPNWVPSNVKFEIDDCCDEWLYQQPFDLIHIRGLYGSVGNWNRLYTQALEHLQPGGYIEQVETGVVHKSDDGSLENTTLNDAGVLALDASFKFGKSLNTVEEMKDGMIKAGFIDVTERFFKLPIGPWPKDQRLKALGRYQRLVWDESIEMWMMMFLTKVMGVGRLPLVRIVTDSGSGPEEKRMRIWRKSGKTCTAQNFMLTKMCMCWSLTLLSSNVVSGESAMGVSLLSPRKQRQNKWPIEPGHFRRSFC